MKTVPKPPKSVFETELQKLSCRFFFLNFDVGSFFRKLMSDIFTKFRTPLLRMD